MAIFSGRFRFSMIFVFIISIFISGFTEDGINDIEKSKLDISATDTEDEFIQSGLANLGEKLESGKSTLAYFYQSVACSCVAAQCAFAGAAIDSIAEIQNSTVFDFARVDVFYTNAAESLYSVDIVPVFIYYNSEGHEISRLEWDVSADLIRQLIVNAEKKIKP